MIIEFAYVGEVKIAKNLVTSVCDAAHRLQIKFLKDSFVKVTDKDYAAMKAGKKTLEAIQKEKGVTTALVAAAQVKGGGKKGSKGKQDSANAEKGSKGGKGKGGKGGKKKSDTVMFTLTKQAPAIAATAVDNNGQILVQLKENKKGGKGKSSSVLPVQIPPPQSISMPTMPLPASVRAVVPKPPVVIPSSVASIKMPLPPSALPQVKKVMIPPMMRKATLSPVPIGAKLNTVSPTGIRPAGGPNSQQVGTLNAFQVETIKQADGTQIQVLKHPGGGSGQIMKQLRPPGSPPKGIVLPRGPTGNIALVKASPTKIPSRLPPKDALAIAMEAIAGSSNRNQGQLKAGQMTSTAVPPPIAIKLPANPLPVSEIVGTLSPTKPTVVKRVTKKGSAPPINIMNPLATFNPSGMNRIIRVTSPPGVGLSKPILPTAPVVVAPPPGPASISEPKPGIPATVPDDFLEEDSGAESNKSGSGNNALASSKNQRSNAKGKRGGKAAAAAKKSEPVSVVAVDDEQGSTRSSGRVRKVNRKYDEEKAAAKKRAQDKQQSGSSDAKNRKTDSAKTANNRKRKASSEEDKGAPEQPPPTKKSAPNNNRSSKRQQQQQQQQQQKSAAAATAKSTRKSGASNVKSNIASTKSNRKGGQASASAAASVSTPKRSRRSAMDEATAAAVLAAAAEESGKRLRKRK